MKKIFALVLCSFTLVLGGCTFANPVNAPKLVPYFEKEILVSWSGKNYVCKLCRDETKSEITVIKPETICGLKFIEENGRYSAKYCDISVDMGNTSVQKTMYFADGLFSAVDAVFSVDEPSFTVKDDTFCFHGENRYGTYNLYFSSGGEFVRAEIGTVGEITQSDE